MIQIKTKALYSEVRKKPVLNLIGDGHRSHGKQFTGLFSYHAHSAKKPSASKKLEHRDESDLEHDALVSVLHLDENWTLDAFLSG